ncbi:dihydroorotate dehydrogenase [Magnetococcales bacterium HHB-1]
MPDNLSQKPPPSLAVDVAGISLSSPLVLLSGCVAFGEELSQIHGLDLHQIGAICLKGTTLHPKKGNPPKRLAETPSGLLNAIGLQNPGADVVVNEIIPRLKDMGMPCRLIANISGATVEEYGEIAAVFDQSAVDGIEINISCPNVKKGGAAFGADAITAASVVAVVRKSTDKPIITKLSPNVADIAAISRAVIDAGSDALSVINTLMGMAIDIHTQKPILGNVQGGLSGPAIKPIALLKVWQVYQEAKKQKIPIIGQGGIDSAEDAIEFILAGATAVGLCTGLFRNPLLPQQMIPELQDYLDRQEVDHLMDFRGGLKI